MFLVIIAIPIFLLIVLINWHLKKRGKKHLPEMLALPAGLFIIMCYLAYELKIGFLEMSVVFFFGYIIGSLIEHTLREENSKKEAKKISNFR